MAGVSVMLHLKSPTSPLMVVSRSVKEREIPKPKTDFHDKIRNSRVLILGGTGRVGVLLQLLFRSFLLNFGLFVGGRNRERGAAMVKNLGEKSEFAEVDIDNVEALENALQDVDLVVHTAGPFQQTEKCPVLEAAIRTKTAYIDVCDDSSYAVRAKSFCNDAIAANIPAITTAGIYPGVSNVMAAELVRAVRDEGRGEPERLRFSYFTAGTGGAGPTILSTSFLLLGEEVVAYSKGERVKLKPYSGMLNVDFGKGIRKRDVFLLNLPEVRSTHEVLGVPTVSARFGTAPFFWNWGMAIMTNLLPAEFLRDRKKVQQLVELFDPVVRAVDGISGERVSMRVDLECSDGRNTVGLFTHRRLSESVGVSTAAFVLAVLEGSTQPGVWYPEEPEGIVVEARDVLLERASQGTISFVMNKLTMRLKTNLIIAAADCSAS
ncbi:Carboxynorspermidine synthase [Bienertia sinuspersici]